MLKYLHEKRGVKDLVIELGFARGYIVDKYINDDSGYYKLLTRTTGSVYLEFYRNLRAWNQSLPLEERIHVHGVDVERFPEDAPVLMADILKKDTVAIPEKLQFFSEVIASYAEYKQAREKFNYYDDDEEDYPTSVSYNMTYLSDEKTIDSLLSDYKVIREDFRTHLGERFELFDKAMKSLEQYRKYMKYNRMPHQFIYRERFMFENMKALLEEDSSRALYGQFGRCHIGVNQVMNECEWYDHSPLARRINQSEYKGQVMNIAIFYSGQYVNNDISSMRNAHIFAYRDSMDGEECKLFNIENDTNFHMNYQYLIMYQNGKQSLKSGTHLKRSKFHSDVVLSYDLTLGQKQCDFNTLNSSLDPTGNSKFSNALTQVGFGFSIYSEGVFYALEAHNNFEQKMSVGNYKYILSGQSYTNKFGFYTRFSRHFTLSPNIQMAYSRIRLDVQNDSIPSFVVPGFTQVRDSKYANGAFMIGCGLNMKFAIGNVAINVDGFALADVSRKNWKRIESGWNTLDTNSPKTSLTNYGINFGLSFLLFDDYQY